MGTPAPIIVPGDQCTTCWGIGKPFGDIFTPKAITVNISGVVDSDIWVPGDMEAANGSFSLVQDTGIPCIWSVPNGSGKIEFTYVAGKTFLTATNSIGRLSYSSTVNNMCSKTIGENTALIFIGGSVELIIPGVTA